MSIIQKSFVILHHHCTIGSKSAKHSLYQSIFKLKKRSKMKKLYRLDAWHQLLALRFKSLKWRHGVLIALLILVTLTKMIPLWGFIYTTRIYPVIGTLLSPISGIFPFAVGDIFIALSIAWVILYPIYEIRLRKKRVFGRVAEYLLWVYAWFYIAWGLNYSQPNIYYRIGMKPVEVSKAKFKKFAYQYADSLNALSNASLSNASLCNASLSNARKNISPDSIVDDALKNRVRDAVLKEYNKIGYREGINRPFNQHPHAKTMVFTPLSSMAGVTGSMGPFFCEFTLNGDILAHDYPATYAHEFAHFLGVANEGEANFYSYIVCTASADKQVRFSGYYHIFFHVLNNVYDILGEKEGERFLKHIRPEIIQRARNDRHYWLSKRCKALDAAQDVIFELYLRGNHVAEGRKSYSGVIGLILAWEEKIKK